MATLSRDQSRAKSGNRKGKSTYRIQVFVDGVRKTVRLGAVGQKQAESMLSHVEALAAAKLDGSSPPVTTSRWLGEVSDELRDRLVRAGLARAREGSAIRTVGELIARYREKKHPSFKPGTVRTNEQGLKSMLRHFGSDKVVEDLTAGDAKDYRSALEAERRSGGAKLAEATIRKRCSTASSVLRYAVEHRIIEREPFSEARIPRASTAAAAFEMVTPEMAASVLEELPDHQFRLLFGLSRWGGLRVGSEPRLLRWSDITRGNGQKAGRIAVRSPKTERHVGHGSREVPIFPELVSLIDEAWAAAEEGEELVLPFLRGKTDAFLRKPMFAAMSRAGVTPWPRLWHNMRASRQTELEQQFPTHVVCSWLGNSERVAAKHYLKTTEDDFARAVVQKAAQSADDSDGPATSTEQQGNPIPLQRQA